MDIVILCIAGCISRNAVMIVLRDSQEIIIIDVYAFMTQQAQALFVVSKVVMHALNTDCAKKKI